MRRTGPKRWLLLALLLLCVSPLVAQTVFTDTAPATGTDTTSYGRGAVMVDFDGDGLLDLVAANDFMINHFYRQLPDHTFVLANDEWGIPPHNRHTWGILAADFDNDGDDDFYVINLGYPGERNQLFRNDIDTLGIFTDVSLSSGDAAIYPRNFSGTTLDYNNDGLLDIFVTAPNFHNYLLRNDGDLIFTDVSAAAGFVEEDAFRHCTAGDYNNDGWMDIAVGNYTGPNYLYKNNGDGTFVNVAAQAGIESPTFNFGLVLEDFDNDGWQDIWVPKYYLELPAPGTSEIFRNNGDGTFANVTASAQMTGQTDMGHNTGDVDGDGYPDIYIGTGHPGFKSLDILLHVEPDGQGGFATIDMSDSSGITSNGETRCHGMALGDYDQDGFVDIYVNNGGPPTDPEEQLQENFLWRGTDNGTRWLALQLTGVFSNRTAVGARAVALTNTGREVHRILRVGHGFANTDSHILHFGLGVDEVIDRISIKWPSGVLQKIFDPPMGQVTSITEPSSLVLAGAVPNGDSVPGTPLRFDRSGAEITLTWSPSCSTTDIDYVVYEGTLGDYASHAPRVCTTGGLTTHTLTPSEGSTYYLVVPRNSVWEGSLGTDSEENQREAGHDACLDRLAAPCIEEAALPLGSIDEPAGLEGPAGPVASDPQDDEQAQGDLDRDGDIDLVVGSEHGGAAAAGYQLFLNLNGVLVDRTGDFAAGPADPGLEPSTAGRRVRVADMNNDGWLDLISSTAPDSGEASGIGYPWVYMNQCCSVGGCAATSCSTRDWLGLRFENDRIPEMLTGGKPRK